MRKVKALVSIILSILMVFPLSISAGFNSVVQNVETEMIKTTPDIDGIINADEWSVAAYMNEDTVKYVTLNNDFATEAKIYFAYDDNGFYFAADITELAEINGESTYNSFIYSTADSSIASDGTAVDEAGFDGDVFILSVDPLGRYQQAGYITKNDYTPWYCVGLFEGDVAGMFLTRTDNDGNITESVDVVGKATDYGWCFEAMIPWEVIIKDMSDSTYGRVSYTKDELTAPGAQFRCAAIYEDRFVDPEMQDVTTRGRYMTSRTTMADGAPSHLITGDFANLNGLHVYIGEKSASFSDVNEDAWYYEAVSYCSGRGYISGISSTSFAPSEALDRAMFVTILSKLARANTDIYEGVTHFDDVLSDTYYSKAVEWARVNGITGGVSENEFAPLKKLTRQELSVFMTVFAKFIKKNTSGRADLTNYKDISSISEWAYDAMSWMVHKGYITGVGDNLISPQSVATRAQAAQIVTNFMKEYGLNIFG